MNEKEKILEAVKSIMWGWFESEYEYSSRCRELENEIDKELKRIEEERETPQRAIQTPCWEWKCPRCNQLIGLEDRCTKCNQKILWGERKNNL